MTRLVRDQSGMTVVEVLVTMVLMVVVLLATLTAFDAFSTESDANSRLTQAQDTARREVDAMTRALRNATPVGSQTDAILKPTVAGSVNDIVFGTYGGAESTTAGYTRYCVNTTTRSLWEERGATYVDPGTACPSAVTGWSRAELVRGTVANTAATPAFTVDAARRAVGITLQLDGGRSSGTRVQTVRSSAYLRSASGRAPNIAASDVTVTCTTTNGKKTALLQLGAGLGSADPLSASYAVGGLPVGAGGAVTIAADVPVQVAVTITNLLGLKQLLTKTVSC